MSVSLNVDLTGFHLVDNMFLMGLEFLTIPTSFKFSYGKKNPIRPTTNDFVIEHWKTPPQTLSISGVTRFTINKNILADKIPWALGLDTIVFNASVGIKASTSNLINVSEMAYWLINRMGLDDQMKISDVLGLTTKTDIDAVLHGREDRVRTFIYFNYSIYEVMFDRVSVSRTSTRVIFNYDIDFLVLDYISIYDYVLRTKIGRLVTHPLNFTGADILSNLIKV